MASDARRSRRPPGRPRNADGTATADRLIVAASEVCAEYGFDGCTLTEIAERAGVHPTALYNHFASREALLHAAAVRALEEITAVVVDSSDQLQSFASIPAGYLRPEMARQRRVIAEIHLASVRHAPLRTLLDEWHRQWTDALVERLPPSDADPVATVKMLFLLLLGLCHVDDLPAVDGDAAQLAAKAELLVRGLVSTDVA